MREILAKETHDVQPNSFQDTNVRTEWQGILIMHNILT